MSGGYKGLGDIEEGPSIGLSAPIGLMPPPGLSTPPAPPVADPQAGQRPPQPEEHPVGESGPRTPRGRRPRKQPAPRKPATPAARPRTQGTMTLVPVSTFERISHVRAEEGLSAGEVIVIAIESEYDRLPSLIQAPARSSMFETRATRLPRHDEEPSRQLSFRLTATDLDTIDAIVEQVGARSRSHLISAAVNAHWPSIPKD